VSQAVFDAMFSDMDVNLREMGVGDLSVGKKVRAMWEAFHGRAHAYAEAMKIGPEALAEALERNIWPGEQQAQAAGNLARLVYAQDSHLQRQDLSALIDGRSRTTPVFLSPAEVFA
jgi:cytochrome b pre-mRNA-processing protein 3